MALDPESVLAKLDASAPEQTDALRYLKNQVIGHIERKEEWLQRGILLPIVRILSLGAIEAGERNPETPFLAVDILTDEDNAKLQALQLLSSFANAGPSFLSPMHAADVLPAVLSRSTLQNENPQIALAALRVLRDVAATATYASPSSPITLEYLADMLFSDSHVPSLYYVLSLSTHNAEAQITIVSHLIKDLCREERHQSILVSSGILDALATKLASFAVAQGQVIPRAEIIAAMEGLENYIPKPAPTSRSLEGILGAIASIIRDSPYRACKLLYSPSILAIFPVADVDHLIKTEPQSYPSSMELPGLRPTKHLNFEPMSLLLPRMAQESTYTTPSPSNTLRESSSRNERSASRFPSNTASRTPSADTYTSTNDIEGEEAESPMIPWLLTLIRSTNGTEMLMAVSVLASLFKAGFSYKSREADLGLLVVPVLLSMLNDVQTKLRDIDYNSSNHDTVSTLKIVEEAPAILARLITDSELLQKAAFNSNAVKTICKLLKDSYDAPPPVTKSWSLRKSPESAAELRPECRLGEEGQHRCYVHRTKVKESTLRALGAVASFKDDYRKAVVDQDVIPRIVESLTPSHNNPVSVVLAACYAVRMLSRSVGILRTALVDNTVYAPLLQLLQWHDTDVQVAAAATVCNLVMDFSPMRESLVQAGILKALCELAHSHSADLRLNSLWALKHLVYSASVDLKKRCVEELESGWLVRLIVDDTEDQALFSASTKARSERPETTTDMDEDIDMGIGEDHDRAWLSTSFYKTPTPRAHPNVRILRLAETRLEALRESESSLIRKARHDDMAIQEQGLGLIRNLIESGHSSGSADSPNDTTEMIDYLFNTLGQDRLFDILSAKLRVKVLHPLGRRDASGSETRILPPQAKTIESVIYILVHIAASIPRHRQLVVSQTELLKQLAKLFSSHDREVRVALCHLINNLTWQDNASDGPGCSQRALELKNLGFLSKLEALERNDDELDVRERAKSAVWQMKPSH